MEKTIICIGREYGSGGHAIGKILAKRTGYEFYDKDRFIWSPLARIFLPAPD